MKHSMRTPTGPSAWVGLGGLAILLCVPVAALACTTMALGPETARVVAYSYDQSETGAGWVVINPAHAQRQSIVEGPAAVWTATYGSVTFNQFGPGMPAAGMNTEGLTVTLMWNDAVVPTPPRAAPRMNELELIQYLLDTAATVDEAIAALGSVNVEAMVPIQYFMMDRSGAVASFRFDQGRVIVHTGDEKPIPVLSNASYEQMVAEISQFASFGGSEPIPEGETNPDSLTRFALGAQAALQSAAPLSAADAFEWLRLVDNAAMRWQIVFDPGAASINLRSSETSMTQTIAMAAMDYGCRAVPLMADINSESSETVAERLAPATVDAHRRLIGEVFATTPPLAVLGPKVAIGTVAAQRAAMTCLP